MRSALSIFLIVPLLLSGCGPKTGVDRPTPDDRYDVIIEGGRIVDGTGAAWFYGDVAIRGDRIARVTPARGLVDAPAAERIDATGMVVAPGFIDIQSHSRGPLLQGDGRVVSKVTQGITTEIMGEGSTNAPLNRKVLSDLTEDDERTPQLLQQFGGPDGFENWLRAMERNGASVNFGSFVGAGTIRQYGMGLAMGPADAAALDSMRKAVRWAMEDGAFGVASALVYPPGEFAGTAELVEVVRTIAPYGGVYITHVRSEGDRLLEAIEEAVTIGARARVPVEVFHLKAAGQRNWPKARMAVELIDSARAAGIDVQANMYPYVAGGTGLSACMPPWASAEGKLYENLADPEARARIRDAVLNPSGEWEDFCGLATPEGVLVLGLRKPENERWIGMRLSEIADAMNKEWVDAAMDLLLSEEQRIGTIYFLMSEENVAMQLQQPWIKFGTDAGGVDPDSAERLVHPRSYGTYPRILGRYVREQGVLPLEEAIRKMTSAVAVRLSIHDRGVLRPGNYADVVVFDPDEIIDRATFEQPHQLSHGVRDVYVNGVPVVQDGRHTGATPGRIVRGPGYRMP
jgi:dihydroorotase/N-acyl-D-amino-acid deacylase